MSKTCDDEDSAAPTLGRAIDKNGIIERAFEIADTGHYSMVSQILAQLTKENFVEPDRHFVNGGSLRAQLRARCHSAQGRAISAPKKKSRRPSRYTRFEKF
jgi:hypothetical protein